MSNSTGFFGLSGGPGFGDSFSTIAEKQATQADGSRVAFQRAVPWNMGKVLSFGDYDI